MECAVAVSKIVTFGLYREFKRLSLRSGEVSLFLRQDFAESPCRRRYMGGLCSNAELIHNISYFGTIYSFGQMCYTDNIQVPNDKGTLIS